MGEVKETLCTNCIHRKMGEVKETLCTNCIHRDVCMYREDFLETNNKVDNILKMTRFFYDLECPYYLRKFENDIR